MKKIVSLLIILVIVLSLLCINVYAEVQYTSDLCTDTSKASASDSISGRGPDHLFDNLNSYYSTDGWESGTSTAPHWVEYDFGTGNEKKIEKYTLATSGTETEVASMDTPKSFKLQGSNDNTNWIDLDTRTSETGWTTFEKREYTFTNTNSYRYYRLYIDSINGGNGWYTVIGEMEMMEIQPTPSTPTNLTASAGNAQVGLTWTGVTGAISYNVKRATTSGGSYTTIGTSTTAAYTDTAVTNGTVYNYVVTAVNAGGESTNSNEVSAKPSAPLPLGGNKAILEITMTNGTEKEYDLTTAELESFLNWYDSRAGGAAKAYFVFTKKNNIKPFLNRKEYLPYDKIFSFEVKDYND